MTRVAFNDFAEGFISQCIEMGFNEHQSAELLTKVAADVCAIKDDKEFIKMAWNPFKMFGKGPKPMPPTKAFSPVARATPVGPLNAPMNNMRASVPRPPRPGFNYGRLARNTGIAAAGIGIPAAGIGLWNNRGPSTYEGGMPVDLYDGAGGGSPGSTGSTTSTGGTNAKYGPATAAAMAALGEDTGSSAGGSAAASVGSSGASGGTRFDRDTAGAQASIAASRSQMAALDSQIAAAKEAARRDPRAFAEFDRLAAQRSALQVQIGGAEKSINARRSQAMSDETERDRQIAQMQEYLATSGVANRERAGSVSESYFNRQQDRKWKRRLMAPYDWVTGNTRENAERLAAQRERDLMMENRLKQLPSDYYYPQG
jgi:hypothetical protein